MKKHLPSLLATICITVASGVNAHANTTVLTSYDPVFTNAVQTFVNTLENLGFETDRFSYDGHKIEENGTIKTIYGVNLHFGKDNNTGVSASMGYSETEFYAANIYTNLFVETKSSIGFPLLNSTYQTDFIVFSREDCDVETKLATIILMSTNMVADITVHSPNNDSSQILTNIIKKIEIMRDSMARPNE